MKDFRTYISKIKGYSDKTVMAYTTELDKFLKVADYKTATPKTIAQYIGTIPSNSMKNIAIASLKLFFKYQLRNGDIQSNPMVNITYFKVQSKNIIPITIDEMDKILNPKNFHTFTDYVLFETMYLTGMRINELHTLTVKSLSDDAIRITGKGNKQRIIHLPEYAIKNLISIANGGVICPYTYNTLRQKMAYYLKDFKRANLTKTTKLSSHITRHSFASHLHKSGAGILSIKDALGHSSAKTTQGYTHLDMEFLKGQHKLMRR